MELSISLAGCSVISLSLCFIFFPSCLYSFFFFVSSINGVYLGILNDWLSDPQEPKTCHGQYGIAFCCTLPGRNKQMARAYSMYSALLLINPCFSQRAGLSLTTTRDCAIHSLSFVLLLSISYFLHTLFHHFTVDLTMSLSLCLSCYLVQSFKLCIV